MLYVNGDSFAWGVGLDDESAKWPALLAEHYCLSLVNEAQPGGSNNRILRKTIDFVTKHRPTMVVIGWSSYLRTEWPGTSLDPLNSNSVDYNSGPIIQVQPNYDKYNQQDKPRIEEYYKSFNHEWAFDNYINQVLLLQTYLKSCKIQYVFMNALDNYNNEFYANNQKVSLITEEFMGWPKQSYNQWFDKEYRLPDGHLNARGHAKLAEMVKSHVEKYNRS